MGKVDVFSQTPDECSPRPSQVWDELSISCSFFFHFMGVSVVKEPNEEKANNNTDKNENSEFASSAAAFVPPAAVKVIVFFIVVVGFRFRGFSYSDRINRGFTGNAFKATGAG